MSFVTWVVTYNAGHLLISSIDEVLKRASETLYKTGSITCLKRNFKEKVSFEFSDSREDEMIFEVITNLLTLSRSHSLAAILKILTKEIERKRKLEFDCAYEESIIL